MRSALRRSVCWTPSPSEFASDQAELLPHALEGLEGIPQVFLRVVGGDDRSNPGPTLRDRRKDDGWGEHAFLPQQRRQLDRLGLLAGDDRGDGGLALARVEAQVVQAFLEEVRVAPQPLQS